MGIRKPCGSPRCYQRTMEAIGARAECWWQCEPGYLRVHHGDRQSEVGQLKLPLSQKRLFVW